MMQEYSYPRSLSAARWESHPDGSECRAQAATNLLLGINDRGAGLLPRVGGKRSRQLSAGPIAVRFSPTAVGDRKGAVRYL
jgi:hypothetical protein